MKQWFCLFFFVLCPLSAFGQRNYQEAISQGDRAYQRGQYKTAIDKYFAAEAFQPERKDTVKAKVNRVFNTIDSLLRQAELARNEAKQQAIEAERQRQLAEAARMQTQNALNTANQLIGAFYFYGDRFALAFKDNRYYFIDKTGKQVSKLGKWIKAEQFDSRTGFAHVKLKKDGVLRDYLLDTLGHVSSLVTELMGLSHQSGALEMTDRKFSQFPEKILEVPWLKYLNLNGNVNERNTFGTLPSEIGYFRKLRSLQMAYCNLDSLPDEIGGLIDLTSLDLSGNHLNTLPTTFSSLSNLKYLDLGGNNFGVFPYALTQIHDLQRLDFYGNYLSSLPETISYFDQLRYLDLSGNRLTTLPEEIKELKQLKTLDLRDNPIPGSQKAKIREWLPACEIRF